MSIRKDTPVIIEQRLLARKKKVSALEAEIKALEDEFGKQIRETEEAYQEIYRMKELALKIEFYENHERSSTIKKLRSELSELQGKLGSIKADYRESLNK